ncbi:MAG: hypothetical protein FJY92_01710, partial [Candidatus Hydrogenedentes bacterium]|nr:hypothetical protein [Candidatus Hydrogenedentota bacterium]
MVVLWVSAFCLQWQAGAVPGSAIVTVQPGADGAAQLTEALGTVRANNKDMQGDLVIEIGDGTLHLDKPLVLDASHSGSNGHYVVFRAAAGARPVISRGQRIGDWVADEDGRWRAPLGGRRVRQLFVDNVRAQRARGVFPEGAERYGDVKAIDADAGFIVPDAAMAQWKNAGGIVLGFYNSWSHMTCDVAAIAAGADGRARVRMRMPA